MIGKAIRRPRGLWPTSMNNKEVSYGRETARSLIRFRLTSSVIRKIVHKIAFLGHSTGTSGALYLTVLTQRNIVSEFHREKRLHS